MKRDWDSKDVEAEILSSYKNAAYRGEICEIKGVSLFNRDSCEVRILSTDQTIFNVRYEDLKPVRPEETDKVV